MNLVQQFVGAFVRASAFHLWRIVSARPILGFVLAFALIVAAGVASAGTVPYKFNGLNVTRDSGVTYLRGTSPSEFVASGATVSNRILSGSGSANWYVGTGALLQNGGVVFNAAVPIAATAASVAVTAIRANPSGLITSAIASYLLGKGIELVNGELQKSVQVQDGFVYTSATPAMVPKVTVFGGAKNATFCANGGTGGEYSSAQQACESTLNYCRLATTLSATALNITASSFSCFFDAKPGYTDVTQNNYPVYLACPAGSTVSGSQCAGYTCPAGSTLDGTQCKSPNMVGSYVPTVESDWDAARVGYWPDPAIRDLVKAGVPLPFDKAVFTPPYQDVPVGDPVTDPVTGKRFQDMTRVTPSPTDPSVADTRVFKQEVDSNGVPVIDPATSAPVAPEPEDSKDPCLENPERVGCKELGTPEDIEHPTEERGVSSVTPVVFAGNASCPADIPLPHGATLSWSYPCQMATGVRPFLLALAWLAAGLIVIGAVRSS